MCLKPRARKSAKRKAIFESRAATLLKNNPHMNQPNQHIHVNVTKCRPCHDVRRYQNGFTSRFSLENRFAPSACTIRILVCVPVACASRQIKASQIRRVILGTQRAEYPLNKEYTLNYRGLSIMV